MAAVQAPEQAPLITPTAPEGTVFAPESNWTLFRSLPKFDLRNGDPSEVKSVFIKSTIPTAYHWVPVSGLAPIDASEAVDGFIKSQLAYMTANRPSAITDGELRKVAIAMGTIRAVSTCYYRLTTSDIIAGELAAAVVNAYREPSGNIKYTPAVGVSQATADIINSPLNLSQAEQEAVSNLILAGMGVIPNQGYSLIMTNHHYLSTGNNQSKKAFTVMEKAFFKGAVLEEWLTSSIQTLQDAMWHKACHPVKMDIKLQAAMDPLIGEKLKGANASACASRLPALESELRTANSYLTLLATVSPMFSIAGGKLDFTELSDLVDVVKAFPPGVPNPVLNFELPPQLVGIITNRVTAVAYLGEALKRNQDNVALCYGFYVALSETSAAMGIGAAAGGDTLKSSFSLTKLRTQSIAAFTAGIEIHGDYLAARNQARAKGDFKAPTLVFQ